MSNASSRQIAGRYASALFDMAVADKAVDAVQDDLISLVKLAEQTPELHTLLTSPLIDSAQAEKAIAAILTKAKAHKVTAKFLSTLAANRRLAMLGAIAEQFGEKVEQGRGEMTAQVESAAALGAAEQKQVSAALTEATGKKVKLNLQENPSLLGGLVVRFGGKRLDLSVAGRLDRLAQSLRRA